MIDGFYRAFENRFRGSRQLIKERLRVYLAFLEPLRALDPAAAVLDLGCGRGEWLELLQENGFRATGVDLDEGMLAACREAGLSARHGDAIETLKSLADASQIAVSGFHIAEHLPFDVLKTLVSESLRVLKPGGLLLLETPNPENILISTVNFYLDPTHQRPIPPLLLSFLAEHSGFARVKTLRLQESAELRQRESVALLDVFYGASPDFSIAAQKAADDTLMKALDRAFDADYGLNLDALLLRYDAVHRAHAAQVDARLQALELAVERAEQRSAQAESRAEQAEILLSDLQRSHSWRITRPLRWLSRRLDSTGRQAPKQEAD